MKSYNIFLDYYDKIVRSVNNPLEDEVEFLVEDCIKEYAPDTKTILETACGTGTVARELIKLGYDVTGLDISENMLKKAEENLDKNKLILGDMRNFNLNKQFDCILCNYNSVCHLLEWKDWQDFFISSAKHLKKGGLFIFDINTLYEFENITRDFAQFYNFGKDTVCLEMFKKDKYYEWLIKIFKNIKENNYELIEEIVRENSFSIDIIKKELKLRGFRLLNLIDYHYGEVNPESERVYFICEKK